MKREIHLMKKDYTPKKQQLNFSEKQNLYLYRTNRIGIYLNAVNLATMLFMQFTRGESDRKSQTERDRDVQK